MAISSNPGWGAHNANKKKTECSKCGGMYKALHMHENKLSCRKRVHSLETCRSSVQAMMDRGHSAFRMRGLVPGGQLPGTIAASFFTRNAHLADPLDFVLMPDGDNLGRILQLCTGPKNLIDFFSFLSALKGDAIRKLDKLTRYVVGDPAAEVVRGLLVTCLLFLTQGFQEPELTTHNFLDVAKGQSRGFLFNRNGANPREASAVMRSSIYQTLITAQGQYA